MISEKQILKNIGKERYLDEHKKNNFNFNDDGNRHITCSFTPTDKNIRKEKEAIDKVLKNQLYNSLRYKAS